MDRNLRWRTLGLVALIVFCVAYLLPTIVGNEQLPSWFFQKKITKGLDLQGGLHTNYHIDLDKAVDDKAAEIKRDLETRFAEEDVAATVSTPATALGAVTVKLGDKDAAKKDQLAAKVLSDYDDIVVKRDCAPTDGPAAICLRVSSDYADGIKTAALKTAVETIRERIDERGVTEPTVITKDDDIIVEIPGLDEEGINRIKDIIKRTAKLEFKIVEENSPFMKRLYNQVIGQGDAAGPDPDAVAIEIKAEADTWKHDDSGKVFYDYFLRAYDRFESVAVEAAKKTECWTKESKVSNGTVQCKVTGRQILERYLTALAGKDPTFKVPDDRQIGYELVQPDRNAKDQTPFWRTYFLDRAVRLSGSAVSQAAKSWDQTTNHPIVVIDFNRAGGKGFGDLTSQNVGRKMAIILDDKVNSAPIIQSAIRGGRSTISMGGSDATSQDAEADDLVAVLKTGSLPAPLIEGQSATIGPMLGSDAIDKAKFAFGLGILLVVFIMVYIYRFSGVLSLVALGINILMMLTALALFGATLTLPGIAALVLTVGMAVDGNIIIYERIREELIAGKSVRGAVDLGFSRAFSTILDGHVTTAAGGWVLLQYGSGPIHGFAVMLLVGIACTLFTSTWVSRLLFDWYVSRKKGSNATISI